MSTLVKVTLPSGNKAIYDAAPQLLTKTNTPVAERVRMHAKQIAVQFNGTWFARGGKDQITDPRTLRLLADCPEV